jgi:hypothetical protein
LALCLPGCGGDRTEDYVQTTESARSALEASLNAWKNGEPHGTIKSGETAIDVFDTRWRDGAKLESFTIGEEVAGDDHKQFRVSMRFEGALQDEENTYRVMGINPINVFRDEDYEAGMGM